MKETIQERLNAYQEQMEQNDDVVFTVRDDSEDNACCYCLSHICCGICDCLTRV